MSPASGWTRRQIRILSATGTLVVVAFYLIAQMVGAGKLIELLFGLDYLYAVVIVGVLMIVYVVFGGMKATTWVQIIKACLLLAGATFMALVVLWRYGFSPEAMFADAVSIHPRGDAIMAPGGLVSDPVSTISLGLALMFGTAGLPHILMRFFTVSDAKAARKSVFYATGFIAYFYILTFIIGFGAITFLMTDPAYFKVGPNGVYNKINGLLGGTNMAAIHLAERGWRLPLPRLHLGGRLRDYPGRGRGADPRRRFRRQPRPLCRGHRPRAASYEQKEVNISKISAVVIGIVAIVLGYVFENQNVAFMVGLAFAVAASCNFPVLLMSHLLEGNDNPGRDWPAASPALSAPSRWWC